MAFKTISTHVRFMDKFDIVDGCWNWKSGHYSDGYAAFWGDGENIRGHIYMWESFYGKILHGFQICHKCDNVNCVRIDHLYLGTQNDNIQDQIRCGSFAKGSKSGHAKLRESDVLEIRRLYSDEKVNQYQLAKLYGLKQPQVSSIIRRVTWRNI